MDILKKYRAKYPEKIKLFLNPQNLGGTRNAFILLQHATGDYLAVCEGDDYWCDENKLQMQIDFLDAHPEFVGCTHKFTVVDEKENPLRNQYLSWIKDKKNFTLDDFQGMYLPGQPATLVRRNLVKTGQISTEYLYRLHKNVGDKTMMLLYLLHGNFYRIDKVMSCYRKSYSSHNTITGRIARDKLNFLREDYSMLLAYEDIAAKNGVKLSCEEGKKIIFAKAVFWGIFKINRQYIDFAFSMVNRRDNKISYVAYIPKYIMQRVFSVMRGII